MALLLLQLKKDSPMSEDVGVPQPAHLHEIFFELQDVLCVEGDRFDGIFALGPPTETLPDHSVRPLPNFMPNLILFFEG